MPTPLSPARRSPNRRRRSSAGLDVELRQRALERAGQPPDTVAEQEHDRRQKDDPYDGGVEHDRDREADPELAHARDRLAGEDDEDHHQESTPCRGNTFPL